METFWRSIATFWKIDPYLPEKENNGYGDPASYDLWSRDIDPKKTSGEEAGSGLTKHGEIVVEYHEEWQDPERGVKT